jgi:adenylate kinase family enzyme
LISIIGPPASGKATLAEQWRGDFVHRVIKALT